MAARPQAYFQDRVTVSPDGCWLWNLALDRDGYGRVGFKAAHRLAYESFVGPIPEGLTIDHLCRVRHCVNPRHLEPVTHQENRGRAAGHFRSQERPIPGPPNPRKTHCKNGHLLEGDNVRHYQDGKYVKRVCLACAHSRSKAWREARK